MADLYKTDPKDLIWDDLDRFLHLNLPEGETLEYKKDFGEGAPEVIAAMANTRGGIILVGVQEDTKTKRPQSAPGIAASHFGAGTLGNLCHRQLQPTYLPLHNLIALPNGPDRGIMVIRVLPEHAPIPIWHEDRGIQVRVGDQNRPADLLTLQALLARGAALRSPQIEEADEIIADALQSGGTNETWVVVGGRIESQQPQDLWTLPEVDKLSGAVYRLIHGLSAPDTDTKLIAFWREDQGIKRKVEFFRIGVVLAMFGWNINPFPVEAAILGLRAGVNLIKSNEVYEVFRPAAPIELRLGVVSWPNLGISAQTILGTQTPRPIGTPTGRRFSLRYTLGPDTDPWSVIVPFTSLLLSEAGYRVDSAVLAQPPNDAALGLFMRSGDFPLP